MGRTRLKKREKKAVPDDPQESKKILTGRREPPLFYCQMLTSPFNIPVFHFRNESDGSGMSQAEPSPVTHR